MAVSQPLAADGEIDAASVTMERAARVDAAPGDHHWASKIEAASSIDDPGDIPWHDDVDLVVVGFGGAGAAAALQAVEMGASVVCLDRFYGGGATEASGGVLYAGGGTSVQKEAGVADDPDTMFRYLKMEAAGIVSDETLTDFCETSPETIEWLKNAGVDFRGVLYPEKTSYPGVDYFLYHSDNTLISPFKEAATPAARGHRGYSPPEEAVRATGLGGPIYRPMRQKFEAEGGKTVEQSEVRQLILDRSGAVIGLKALEFIDAPEQAAKHRDLLNRASAIQAKWLPIIPGSGFFLKRAEKLIQRARDLEDTFRKPVYYRARRGVVLSAGGFIFNREMVRHYAPDFKDAFPLGTTADQGDGIRLGQTAGGAVGNMERASAWRFINPPIAWSQGVVVNMRGERFVNESAYGAKLGTDIATEQDGKAWSIVDARLAKESLAQIKSPGVLPFQRQLAQLNFRFAAKKARSIKALAQKIGIDPGALEKTVSDYNARSGSGDPDPFGKSPGDIAKLEAAPYYAINIGVSAPLFPCPTITLGGLKVNEKSGRVLDAEGAEIQGLYAAGRTAIGICSWNYLSGLSIADCVYSGRRAARHACGVNLPAEAVSD